MKKLLLTCLTAVISCSLSYSQISVSTATSTGPVVGAGWSIGGTASAPGPHVQLTANTGSQAGQLWYNTPLSLTGCGSFVADFDYQIITPTASPTPSTAADGLAFWIVNPLTGFVGGGGIGLPTNPNGLVLIFDTYDNDGVGNDPLVSMYGYPAGFTGTYVEGATANRLGFLNNQNYLYDNGWHHAKVTYSGGNVKVYLDYSATPNMTGFFPITTPGYFGFCASTGAVTSIHNVRNVYVNADVISAIVGPGVVCVGTNTLYTDSTAGGTWSSSNTTVGTINATTGMFTPLTGGTTTIQYSYSSSCNTSRVITVNASPLPPITGPGSICSSSPTTYSNTTTGGTWSVSNATIASITGGGLLTPLSAGVVSVTYTLASGCFVTTTVTINSAPPPLSITPAPATVCDNGGLALTATGASAYDLFAPNGFESGVPTTAGAPVNQWRYTGTPTSLWHQLNGTLATTPTIGAAHGGTYVAKFNCRSTATGTTAALYSPSFSMVGVGTATLSFWVYRDVSNFNTAGYNTEGITVYVNTTPAVGGTNLGFVPRRGGLGITGPLTGTSTTGSGWFQYTVTIPTAFTGATNYIVFSGNSNNGNNIYLDDVTLTGTIATATWTPTTWLFNDAGFTTPYTGTALNPVHMHPTGVTTPTTITYTAVATNGSCTSSGTTTVTVNPNPAAITGIGLICLGATTTLNSTTAGGAWTSLNTSVATVNPTTGVAGGMGLGTATIVYAIGTCSVTTVVTVVTSPGTITGPNIICLGQTATYTNPTAGGVWSSQFPLIASIGSTTGIANGDALGTSTITYGIGTCYSTKTVTVNPVPGAITGSLGLCTTASTTLSSSPAGGFWSSSAPTIASVGPLSGVVTAGSTAPATAVISYTRIGCSALATVNVVSTPTPITGTLSTCYGSTTTLGNATPGGTWSSSNTAIATVDPAGVVTGVGVAGGTSTITYTVSAGCFTTAVVTVVGTPTPITGSYTVCAGASTTLGHATPSGTWQAPCPAIGSIGLSSGIFTAMPGISGTCVVTYTLPGGCIATATVTVQPVPANITGTMSTCVGTSATLANATPSGSWSMACPTIGTINSTSGSWTGIGGGTCIVSYSLSTGCRSTATVTVDPAPTPIAGTFTVCVGGTTALTSGPGAGAWSSTNTFVATVSGGGVVTGNNAGTSTIIFTLVPGGCSISQVVTVIATPGAITGAPGAFALCVGNTTTLNASPAGGTWSSTASAIAPIVTSGVSAGTPYVVIGGTAPGGTSTIIYTVAGCSSSSTVTVNTLPGSIGGTLSVCMNSCTTLTNATGGGTWSSSTPAVGTIGTTTGTFCGLSAGTATVTYSLGSGCIVTAVVTVNATPNVISGLTPVCENACINLTGNPTPGTWSSSDPTVGTIGSSTGTFCGVSAGTTTITYTRTSTGCYLTAVMTVNAIPTAISGSTTMCAGTCTTLTGTPAGGTWISGNATVGTINTGNGQFCGLSAGTSIVSYILPNTCRRTQVVAVDPLPTGVSGALSVCESQCTTLTGIPGGGTWASGSTATATIGLSSGSLCGVSNGTVNITYTLPSTCALVVVRTVNQVPTAITGLPTMCVGMTTTLSSTPAGGVWSSGNTSVATVDAAGVVTGQSGTFTSTISYTMGSGCRSTTVVTVMGLPSAITGTMQVCENGATTTLNCTPAGGTWSMACPATATINSGGVVTGGTAGTCTATYTLGTGCIRTAVVTVNPVPAPITGAATMCVGGTTTLNSTPGGTWTSSNNAVASVVAGTGVVTGNSGPLTATITYTNSFNCRATRMVTVYALPSNIAGPLQGCVGTTVSLSSPGTPGGTWSSSDITVATIDVSTGVLTCTPTPIVAPATTTITYTLGTGCIKTAVFTVNPLPADIMGITSFCQYECIALNSATPGGVWSTSTPAILAQSSTTPYIFCGPNPGTGIVSYTMPTTGCYKTFTTTVQPIPSSITGPSVVCVNETITLSGNPTGGNWSGGGTNASIDPSTGVVTGLNAGTDIVTYHYAVTGCILTKTVSVNPLPNAITGIDQVCVGLTTTLSNSSGGGSWTSSTPAVGSIDASGVVTGITAGTTLISYTFISTGCRITRPVTVNQLPTTILGPDAFCNYSDATYSSTPTGGTWTSSNNLEIDFANPLIGIASGHGTPAITTTITYTLPTGCTTTKDVSLILAPFSIAGQDTVCENGCVTLSNIIGGGSWTVVPGTGNVTLTPATPSSVLACATAQGTATVSYTLSTGCSSSLTLTVNPLPNPITGVPQVCVGLTTDLDNTTTGGNWSSSNGTIATVGATDGLVTGVDGGVSGNTVTITYSMSTGCNAIRTITVNPLPDAITGTFGICEGTTTTLLSGPTGGTWTSNDPVVATVGATTGVVTGLNAYATGSGGMGQTMITYTLPTGCIQTQTFSVNPLPSPINGIMNICQNDVTVLGNATPGGSWVSSNPAIASVNPFGVVTGNAPGSVVISYVMPTGCMSTWPMTVSGIPDAITGSLQVCAGFATNLHSGPAGGVWSQDPASLPYGTINPVTGVVSAITGGLIPVSYTLGSGCRIVEVVTVVNLPPTIGGDANVCEAGGTTLLTHTMGGGIWSSSDLTKATVDPVSGLVTGVNAGTATITFSVGTGCFNIRHVTVNPLPAIITGQYYVCQYSQVTLANATPGGTWISGNTTVGTIGNTTGIFDGLAAGESLVSYKLTTTGCQRTANITVNPTPAAISGNPHICMGWAETYTSPSPGGLWINGNPAVISFASTSSSPTGSATVLPVTLGSAIITYQFSGTGCQTTKTVSVQPLPIVFNVTGGGNFCAGGAGVPVGLDSSQPGVSYELRRGSIAAGYINGTGFPISFGLQAVAGVYTVQAVNATSGCRRNMAGSATVTVTSSVTPTVTINTTPGDSVCPGETVTLTPSHTGGGTAPTYVWKVNGVTVGAGSTYSFVPAPGDLASVTMTSNGTCISTAMANASRPITVLPAALPIANMIVSPNDSVCEHTPVTLTAAPMYGGSAPTYAWTLNGAPVSTSASYTYVPTDGDILNYTLTSNYRCRLANTVMSGDVELHVAPMVIPHVDIHANPGLAVMTGKPVTLTAVAWDAGSAPTYQWMVNGVPVAGATNSTYTAVFNDKDSIACRVVSSGICHNIGTSDWVFITINPTSTTTINGNHNALTLHPNPNKGQFTVRGTVTGNGNEDAEVDITNMLGQVVYRGTLEVKQGKVNAQIVMDRTLANGMYILTLRTQSGPQSFHFVMEQ